MNSPAPSRSARYSSDERIERSLQHSIRDGIAFSTMGGFSESYFAAYAILLRATTQQVAMLASVPPLLASFTQLFAVWLGQATGMRRGIIVAGAVLQACALLCLALLPWQFPAHAFVILLTCVVIYHVGPNIGAPLWGSLMGSIVPESLRGRFFAQRTRLSSVASFSALLCAGAVLQAFTSFEVAAQGFIAIFLVAVFARAVSAWHLHHIYDPPRPGRDAAREERDAVPSLRLLRENPKFLRFSLFNAAMQGAVAVSGPFVVVYLLRDLHYSYVELTCNTAASVLMQYLVLNRWGRLGDLFGNLIILRVTGFAIPLVPLLWVLSADFWYLLLVQALSGLIWSGFSLSASNFIYDLTPAAQRGGLMAAHNLFAGLAVFGGASAASIIIIYLPTSLALGGWSLEWSSVLLGIFVLSCVLRLVVAATFLPHLDEVRAVRPMTYHGLAFRVTRFSPVSGLIFEIITRSRRRADKPSPPGATC